MDKINYQKVDPWIKANPDARYREFVKAHPRFKISVWSFAKRRAFVLGLPMTPSMKPGYRSSKKTGAPVRAGRSRSVYTALWSVPVKGIEKKPGPALYREIIDEMNNAFKLHLEVVQISDTGTGEQQLEIRRYNR